MAKLSLNRTAELLLEQDDLLILCHKYPDGDTLGSAFALCRALRSLGKRANVMCSDIIPPKFDYLHAGLEPDSPHGHEFIVAVDVADTNLLGVLEQDFGDKVKLCIDHHPSNRLYAENTLLDGGASAVGEIIYRLLTPLGVELTPAIAAALYTAISTDTGCFRYSNVTSRTHRIAAKLLDCGIDSHEINRAMFETKTRARLRLERDMLETLDFRLDGRMVLMTLTEQMIEESGASEGDTDGLSAIPRGIEGVDIGVMLREVSGGCKISLRTTKDVNASEICKLLGGGGHAAAAGCFVKGTTEVARDKICEAVEQVLGEE